MGEGLHELDAARLDRMIELAVTLSPARIAAHFGPGIAEPLASRCELVHLALLVFPSRPRDLLAALDERGFRYGDIVPSTVVRDRLRRRHQLPAAPEVFIVHARTTLPDGSARELEIFLAPAELTEAAQRERIDEAEHHVAFTPRSSAEAVVPELHALLLAGGLVPDDGGFNPHEDRTVLYFRRPLALDGISRLEVLCAGAHPALLGAHLGLPASDTPIEKICAQHGVPTRR